MARRQSLYASGDRCWLADEAEAWVVATVKSKKGQEIEFTTESGSIVKIDLDKKGQIVPEVCGGHLGDDVSNLVDLDELSEVSFLSKCILN